jgi:hypothetical protein
MSEEQCPEEVWEVGPVDDPGVVLGPPMPAEEFPRTVDIIEMYAPGQTMPNSIGNYIV